MERVVDEAVAVDDLAGVRVDEHGVADVRAVGHHDVVDELVGPGHALDEARSVDQELRRFRAELGCLHLDRRVGAGGRWIGLDEGDRSRLRLARAQARIGRQVDCRHDRAVDCREIPRRVDVDLQGAAEDGQALVALRVGDVRRAERVGGGSELPEV